MDRIYRQIIGAGLVWATLTLVAAAQFNNNFDSPPPNPDQIAQPFTNADSTNDQPGNATLNQADLKSDSAAPDTSAAEKSEETTEPSAEANSIGGSAKSFIGVFRDAGFMAIPIACCSVLLVMFVFERAFSLRKSRVIPKHFVRLFLTQLEEGQLKPEEALEQCEESSSPIAEVFAAAVKKWNRPAVEVEQAVIDAGEREANGLRRYLRLFNGIATITPLLGLLGTVLGMIRAFNAIAASDAMGKPELLAEGIGQALLTTAGGLSVAIPAFIAYMYFSSRVDRLLIEIDGLGQQLVSAISNDSWKGGRSKSRKAA